MGVRLEAFHLPAPGGLRFCVARRPPAEVAVRGAIVHVPAFAEELNKSRRMVALQADGWARAGWLVLQVDLGGCGDSEGDFADASWDGWLDDVRRAYDWACGQTGGKVWLWGLRLGALLATAAAQRFDLRCGLLLWQPVSQGAQHLQQFLRLWKMAQVLGKAVESAQASPQQRLAAGETVEVGGYELGPALARGLEAGRLEAAAAPHGVHWFQVGAGGATPPPAFERLAAQWRAAGVEVGFHAVSGPSFWQTQEIELAPELLEASRRALGVAPLGQAAP